MEHIETFSGEIEAVGQSSFDLKGTFYAYIRFVDKSGNVRMIKNIGVPNTVNSYILPGARGHFHISRLNKKGSVLFAFDNEERKVYDSEEMNTLEKAFRAKGWFWIFALPVALISILIFGIGLILTPMCIYFAYVDMVVTPRKLKDLNLRSYLSQYGYS